MAPFIIAVCLAALHGDDLLVATDELSTLGGALVVDARPERAYTGGHIPGAAHLDVDTLSETRGEVVGLLKPLSVVRRSLRKAGIDPSKQIVVYSEVDTPGDFKTATRLFWILEYVGYDRVSILNGGFAKWKAEGREVAEGESAVDPVKIPKLTPREDRLATAKEVQEAIEKGTAKVADLRSPDYYRGETKADIVQKAGHIPTACNLPSDEFLSSTDNTVKSWEEVQALAGSGGITADSPAITYCNTGRSASVGYFMLRMLGNENVSLYDGSLTQWTAKRKDMETSAAAQK